MSYPYTFNEHSFQCNPYQKDFGKSISKEKWELETSGIL